MAEYNHKKQSIAIISIDNNQLKAIVEENITLTITKKYKNKRNIQIYTKKTYIFLYRKMKYYVDVSSF